MNALNELLGSTISQEDYEELVKTGVLSDNSKDYVVTEQTYISGRKKYAITPRWDSEYCLDWVKTVKFAKVDYSDGWEESSIGAFLRSSRTEEDELEFLQTLFSINYNSGFGGQELFGIIVFKDGTWLERHEYDGSEWWEKKELPLEEDCFNN